MELAAIYSLVLCTFLVLPLFHAFHWLFRLLRPCCRVLSMQINLRVVPVWPRPLVLNAGAVVLVVGANLTLMLLPPLEASLSSRAATLAVANLTFIFLCDTCEVVHALSRLRIHVATYRALRQVLASVVAVEAVIHVAVAARARAGRIALELSGFLACGVLAVLLPSFWMPVKVKKLLRKKFIFGCVSLLQSLLVAAGQVGWIWHALAVGDTLSIVLAALCAGMWGAGLLYWIYQVCFHTRKATVSRVRHSDDVIRYDLRLHCPTYVPPGAYFYISEGHPLFHPRYPMVPMNGDPQQYEAKVDHLSFLVCTELQSTLYARGQLVYLDGPYGQDLRARAYENVILVAKGLGILGVLPFAFHLAARRGHDDAARNETARLQDSNAPIFRDVSRNVDLIWWLEDNAQEEWVRDQFEALQQLEGVKDFLVVWCSYPSPPTGPPPFQKTNFWKVSTNLSQETFTRELRQETRYPGKTLLLASGNAQFLNDMRQVVRKNTTATRAVDFSALEYTPPVRHRRVVSSGLSIVEVEPESPQKKSPPSPLQRGHPTSARKGKEKLKLRYLV